MLPTREQVFIIFRTGFLQGLQFQHSSITAGQAADRQFHITALASMILFSPQVPWFQLHLS
jgi:hypothetical protein